MEFFSCLDPSLMGLSEDEIASACMWRRALMAVVEVSRIQHTMLSKRLAITTDMANALVQRLEMEGFLKSAGKGRQAVSNTRFDSLGENFVSIN